MSRFAALVMALGVFVVAGSVFIGQAAGVDKVLLLTAEDRTDPQLRETIAGFTAWGHYVTDRPEAALRASRNEDLAVFVATRRAFNAVPEATWAELYGRGVVIGGVNVSRSELLMREPASGGLEYTPDRAIFSFAYWSRKCGTGATSDWLGSWNLPGVIDWRVDQIRLCAAE